MTQLVIIVLGIVVALLTGLLLYAVFQRGSQTRRPPGGITPSVPHDAVQLDAETVSKIRHELRTPIVAIQQSLSLLADQVVGPLSDEQRRFVEVAQRNIERLNTQLDELLDPAKLRAKTASRPPHDSSEQPPR